MCIETNDFWDATNSWSGYNYQGKIALYYGIRKINELITIGKACDIEKYAIEIEWKEDFSIVYIEDEQRVYQSIHQVKAKENTNIYDYEDALVKLYQKVQKDRLISEAFLHVCRELDFKGNIWKNSIEQIIKNGDMTKAIKEKVVEYRNSSNEEKRKKIDKLNGKGRNSKENNLIKQYNTMYFHFKKVTVNNIDEILNKIIEDLETQIRACMQNIHQADLDKIVLYAYPGNKEYCGIDEINNLLQQEILNYWTVTKAPDWKNQDTKFCNNVCLCLQGLMDKHITERHINYGKTTTRDISFRKVVEILDSNTSIERCEEYYLYVIKQRLMKVCSEYHTDCQRDWDSEEERKDKCEHCEIKSFVEQMSGKSGETLKEFLHAINPDIINNIDSDNWERFCNDLRYRNPFLKGLRDIKKIYEKDKKYVSYIDGGKRLNLLTTIIKDEDSRKDAMRICSKIVKNHNLNEVLMDYDYLISKNLNIDSVFYGAGDYLENFKLEENHVYHYKNLKIKSLDKSIKELEGK